MESYKNFTKEQIPEFIKIGNDLIDNRNELEDEIYLNKFQEYSRYYMNFIMNNTHFINFLYMYKLLLLEIENNTKYIKDTIILNNYVLSIINGTNFNQKISISNNFIEYKNYFLSVINLITQDYDEISLKKRLTPIDIVSNINILESRYKILNELSEYEKNDYKRFFYLIGNEIYLLTNCELLKNVLNDLKNEKDHKKLEEILIFIIRSFYNILLINFKEDLKDIESVLNPLDEKYITDNENINKLMKILIQDKSYNLLNKNTVMGIVSVIGFLVIDSKYNLL